MNFFLRYFRLMLMIFIIAVLHFGCGDKDVPDNYKVTVDSKGDYDTGGDPNLFYDILSMLQWRDGNNLKLVFIFDKNVVLPPPGISPTEPVLNGYIWFDADQDSTTGGGNPFPDVCSQATSLNGEYVLFIFSRLPNGNYEVQDDRGSEPVTGEATPYAQGKQLHLTIPLSAIGNDDGNMDIYARLGLELGFHSDCVPGGAPK